MSMVSCSLPSFVRICAAGIRAAQWCRRERRLTQFTFTPCDLPPETKVLRGEVRAFLAETLVDKPAVERARSWSGGSREFSRKLGAQGWIGMTWPKRYGGHERSYAERYVVIEELLVAGAPVGSHWVADRQSGPLLLRFGTEEQRHTLLPAIARGELCFCIGMSEPGAGSDLASVRTRGRRVEGGWKVSGQKIWTSNAQHADWMIALVRHRRRRAASRGFEPAARRHEKPRPGGQAHRQPDR